MDFQKSSYLIVKEQMEKKLSELAENFSTKCSEIPSRYFQPGVEALLFRFSRYDRQNQRFTPPPPKGVIRFFLMSWYIEDEVLRTLVQLYLVEKVKMLGPDYEIILRIILKSKSHALNLVLLTNILGRNPNELFGVLNDEEVKVRMIVVNQRKPKKVQRHRGYRDKGSRRLGIEFLREEQKDYSLRDLQQEIELKRETLLDATALLEGFFSG